MDAMDLRRPRRRAAEEARAVILGRTTMPHMGMMAAGVSSLYGITHNPWDLSRNTGGSSSGASASASASGIGFGSVGSDIAGSARLPAGHCGLVALKPAQGRIPHLAPSTMHSAGAITRTVEYSKFSDWQFLRARAGLRDPHFDDRLRNI
ncbi:amidase family protein [Rhodococcus sp. G-MC3]|uniref:amidase family protein n=1 Tax=Rhodococcus sp. G-MC3 TaxID=3046209 RepID=UPI0024BA2DA3|nr:amidase family protein [Rhodococcus sp. G-MC3]MDJ0396033.1 amidase family protein [Rhodococcus sp. G-MC3]